MQLHAEKRRDTVQAWAGERVRMEPPKRNVIQKWIRAGNPLILAAARAVARQNHPYRSTDFCGHPSCPPCRYHGLQAFLPARFSRRCIPT